MWFKQRAEGPQTPEAAGLKGQKLLAQGGH